MKYYIIAGEASGDLHASNLMKELLARDSAAEFRFWGGDKMQAVGGVLVKHYRDLAFMGFVEVIANLRTILRNLDYCKKDILAFNPDVVILVDYPGFNLRISTFTKLNKIKTFYYISPQIWAWKQSRVHQIKRDVDEMFVILPFEKEFYKRFGMNVHFEGHPLLDAMKDIPNVDSFRERHKLGNKQIIALLPGSRKQEIKKMLPIMLEAVSKHENWIPIVAGVSVYDKSFYEAVAEGRSMHVIFGETYQLLLNSNVAAVTSGTATLEAGLIGVPLVVCYKGGNISYQIAKRLIRVKYISLVNLILDEPAVKELIQDELTPRNLELELQKLAENIDERKLILDKLNSLQRLSGGGGASSRVAEKMIQLLS
jgi:lipid-A-disaccharide synthase